MRHFILKKWYPSLPTEWIWHNKDFELPLTVVECEDGYHLHPSLKEITRFAIIAEREVERNEEFWTEISHKR